MPRITAPALAITLLTVPPAVCETIPMAPEHWNVEAATHRFETHLGRPSLRLDRGIAVARGRSLENGTIEFDIAIPEDLGFSGAIWRAADLENYEEFYLRHHLGGKEDAMQYSPVFHGLSGWQIYTGANHVATADYRFDEWMHVKIVVAGDRAEVFVDSEAPVLEIADLKAKARTGMLGLKSNGAPVHFSNFRYEVVESPKRKGGSTQPRGLPEGTVSSWQVSSPFPEANLDGKLELVEDEEVVWSELAVEDSGIANLARLAGVGEAGDTVFARLLLDAEREQTRRIRFGFSDRVRVYLNGALLFAADDSFASRDYRFLGTVGLYDELYLRLEPGSNELRFAITEGFGGWAVICKLE